MQLLNTKLHIISQIIVIIFTILLTISIIFIEGAPFFYRTGTPIWVKIVATLALIATVYISFQKETYLTFLGPAVLPSTVIKDEFYPANADMVVTIDFSQDKSKMNVDDGDKVVFWASNDDIRIANSPFVAYKGLNNSGVSIVKNNKAVLKLRCPSKYKVGYKTLNKHVHYRVISTNTDKLKFISDVKTVVVNC